MKNSEALEIVSNQLEIRKQQPNRLDQAGTKIVKTGMRWLKELGPTNKEIFEALGGAWSEVAIKQMTAGVGAKDPEARRSFGQVLNEIATSGYNGEDLKRLGPIVRSRIDTKVVLEFLEDTIQSGKDPGETLSLYSKMKDNGIGPEIAVRVNATTEVLATCGYTSGTLEKFKKASADYKPDDLLESIGFYRGLQNLKLAYKNQVAQSNQLDSQLRLKSGEIEKTEQTLVKMKDRIAKIEYLCSIGYTDEVLDSYIKIIRKFGQPKDFLEGMNIYPTLIALKEQLLEEQRKYSDEESKLKTKKAENVHLNTLLVMSDELLDLGLSTPAVAKLLEMARKLGLPESKFTAIISFGTIENLEKTKGVLEHLIAELGKRFDALQGMLDTANNDHLEIQKMMAANVDVIRLSKFLLAVQYSPKPNLEHGLEYAKMCLDACQKIFKGMGFKKMVRVRDALGNKYSNYLYAEYEIRDLVHLALYGLFLCDTPGVA